MGLALAESSLSPRGEHELSYDGHGYVCARCGAVVQARDAMSLLRWWAHIHEFSSESWVRN